jgi:hypothetical protein
MQKLNMQKKLDILTARNEAWVNCVNIADRMGKFNDPSWSTSLDNCIKEIEADPKTSWKSLYN